VRNQRYKQQQGEKERREQKMGKMKYMNGREKKAGVLEDE